MYKAYPFCLIPSSVTVDRKQLTVSYVSCLEMLRGKEENAVPFFMPSPVSNGELKMCSLGIDFHNLDPFLFKAPPSLSCVISVSGIILNSGNNKLCSVRQHR